MIKIECPHCKELNGIRLPENAECRHCKKSIDENVFSRRFGTIKAKTAGIALLASGAIIGYIVEDKLDQVRFPIQLEYAIINECAKSHTSYFLSEKELLRNIDICTCALEKTSKDIGYKNDLDNELFSSFNKYYHLCKE